MKTFHFRPASLLAGLAIGAGFLFLTSQTSTVTFPTARVEVGPHPRDMVQIGEGQPFTVPLGKILVLTALGRQTLGVSQLRINGSIEYQVSTGSGSPMVALPVGLSIRWGNTVEPDDTNSLSADARAWGYLAER